MKRGQALMLVAVAICVVALAPMVALASTDPTGTAVTISGLDDTAATAWSYLKGWGGRVTGAGIAIRGLIKMGSTRGEGGGMTTATGVGVAFVPGIISTAFESAPAAGLGLFSPVLGTAQQFLYGLRGDRFMADPLFLMIMATTLVVMASLRRRSLSHGHAA